MMTEDVQAQQGRSESSKDVKGSQVEAGLETGMERTRQKRPNSTGKEVTSCSRDRSQTIWSAACKKGQGSERALRRKAVASLTGFGAMGSSELGGATRELTTAENGVGTARQSGRRAWQMAASAGVETQINRLPVKRKR